MSRAKLTSFLATLALALAHAGPAQATHPVFAPTGDPAAPGEQVPIGAGAGGASGAGALAAPSSPPPSVGLELAGSLELAPAGVGAHADVAAYGNLAFVGKWAGPCPGTGVDIIDITTPTAPRKVADTADHPGTSMEDMQAMRIAGRDVLATGLQTCRNPQTPGLTGLELHDISDPAAPAVLSFLPTPAGGVHEFDLTATPGGRVLALLAVPNAESSTATPPDFRGGTGDLLIVDVTEPNRPVQIAEYGLLDDGRFGPDFYVDATQGADARSYLHSVRANADGTRAYLSYWDAGVITLDISDPARPRALGRTPYEPRDEGNAHSVDEARGGEVLVQADEDYTPFSLSFTSSAFSGERPAFTAAFGANIAQRPSRVLTGPVVAVGRGCPAGGVAAGSPEDPYAADPAGKIALLQRDGCRFDVKAARAVRAGAIGVIIYNDGPGGEEPLRIGGQRVTTLPDGTQVTIEVPVLTVTRSVGVALAGDGTTPVTVRAGSEFDGWGYLRFWDNRDPGQPRKLSTFATPNTLNGEVAAGGAWYSVHNPEVVGDRVYVSWYADGVRVVDISRVERPREVGAWAGQGRPADARPVDIWSVVPHRGLLLASDRHHGLFVLRKAP